MPRRNDGSKFNKTKYDKKGNPYMTCWMIELPNKDGDGTHWYGKVADEKGNVISLSSSGQTQVFEDKKGVKHEYLGVDVRKYRESGSGSKSGMSLG